MVTELKLCPLKSSSKGNATLIYNANTKILVDCGISGRVLEECLERIGLSGECLDAVVVTHEHTDHIKGVGIISRKYNLPVYATYGTWKGMKAAVGKICDENIRVFNASESFYINDIRVTAFAIPHDASEPVGYTFCTDEAKVAVATDMGVIEKSVFDAVKGSDTVLLEANYDPFMLDIGSYPYELKRRIRSDLGHLCNEDSAELARRLCSTGTKDIILGHLSEENNYPQTALEEVRAAIAGMEVCLSVVAADGKILKCEDLTVYN